MDAPIKVTADLPQDTFTAAICSECRCETRHKVLAQTNATYSVADGMVDVWATHQILQCQGCMTESFCKEIRHSEDVDFNPRTGEQTPVVTQTFFPSPVDSRNEME